MIPKGLPSHVSPQIFYCVLTFLVVALLSLSLGNLLHREDFQAHCLVNFRVMVSCVVLCMDTQKSLKLCSVGLALRGVLKEFR